MRKERVFLMVSPSISLIGVLVGLALLIVLCYKGLPLPFASILSATVILLINGFGFIPGLKEYFMTGFVGFVKGYYLLLFASMLFAKLMGDSGAANAIALACSTLARKYPGREAYAACFSMILIASILTAGGVSVFVIIFIMLPIGRKLFQELDIPWHLFTVFVVGTGTYTMGGLPGMPSINNVMPTSILGTDTMAAPILGVVGSIFMIAFAIVYTIIVVNIAKKNGETFMATGHRIAAREMKDRVFAKQVKVWQAAVPPVCVLLVLNVFKQSAELSMLVGCAACVALFRKNLPNVITNSVGAAGKEAAGVVITTSCVVGFGACVTATAGYQLAISAFGNLGLPPALQVVILVNLCAGITGSSAGGLSIALNSFAEKLLATGLNPQVIHRLASISSCGLDSLPHNSAVVIAVQTLEMTHKECYKHFFFLNTLSPLIASILCAFISMLGVV